jgi:hypothetical protein
MRTPVLIAATAATAAAVALFVWRRRQLALAQPETEVAPAETEVAPAETECTDGAGPQKKKWAAFISHYKAEAAMEARYLQGAIEAELPGRRCFIDSDGMTKQPRTHAGRGRIISPPVFSPA